MAKFTATLREAVRRAKGGMFVEAFVKCMVPKLPLYLRIVRALHRLATRAIVRKGIKNVAD